MAAFIPVPEFDIVIFGGTGDLAERKLLPALFHRDRDQQFCDGCRIIGVSRQDLTDESYRAQVKDALVASLGEGELDADTWARFSQRIHYLTLDMMQDAQWSALKDLLDSHPERTRVLYLATHPSLFGLAATQSARVGIATPNTRIVLEKPVGHDLESAQAVNDEVGAVFMEEQIFRIDHYLGKETVQNLLSMRFANSLFEPLWQRGAIDHVQLTVAERLGVGSRGNFYDRTGALRDMVQNHLLQLLCLVAMEPPASLDPEEIRDEKLKVLKALRPLGAKEVGRETVRGQYREGAIDGATVPGYLDALDGKSASGTETFVAIKAHIDNWRWSGVPFYLRTGKSLVVKSSEIVLVFRPVAHSIFPDETRRLVPNRLTIRLQPNEGVRLSLMTKEPGPGGFRLRSLPLDLSFSEAFQLRYPDAYERLLMEVIRGNPALFMRRDEVEMAWRWIDDIIAGWGEDGTDVHPYMAGSWGPSEAAMLLDRDGRSWHNSVDD